MTHGDDEGMLGEVGDGLEPANLTKMAGGPEVEEGIEGGVVARPGPRGSLRRQRLKTAVPLVGWAAKWTGRVGWASTGEAQVSPSLSLFYFFLLFCFI